MIKRTILGAAMGLIAASAMTLAHATQPASAPAAVAPQAASALPPNFQVHPEKLASGVVIEHLDLGPGAPELGASPGPKSTVTVSYVGKLANGTIFDASSKHGGSVSFGLDSVVPCFSESLQHMRLNEMAVVHCPAKTAYGEKGAGNVIPPNSDLTFGVRLLGIK